MKIKELQNLLAGLDPEMEVFRAAERHDYVASVDTDTVDHVEFWHTTPDGRLVCRDGDDLSELDLDDEEISELSLKLVVW